VLGKLSSLGSQPAAAGMHEGGHPVGAPVVRGAAEAAQQPVKRSGQVGEAHRFAKDAAQAPGV